MRAGLTCEERSEGAAIFTATLVPPCDVQRLAQRAVPDSGTQTNRYLFSLQPGPPFQLPSFFSESAAALIVSWARVTRVIKTGFAAEDRGFGHDVLNKQRLASWCRAYLKRWRLAGTGRDTPVCCSTQRDKPVTRASERGHS